MAPDSQPPTTGPAAAPVAPARSSLWPKLSRDPLLTILGTAAVGLLILTLTRTDNHISRLEDTVNAGFAAIDDRFAAVDDRFTAQDAKIDALDAKIDEIDRKLTALIAALNATDEIEAALEGRLHKPGADDAELSAPGPNGGNSIAVMVWHLSGNLASRFTD